jgi:predicted negative regulator of RcsB-dependent stress response
LEEAADSAEKIKDQEKKEQARQMIYHTLGAVYFKGFGDKAKAREAYLQAKENCKNNSKQ